MKKILILGTLLYAGLGLAHTCHISLYDPADRPYLNFYSSNDHNCQAAAQRCYTAVSQYRLNPYQYKCYTISMTEDARPNPTRTNTNTTNTSTNTNTNTNTTSIPKPSGEARRDIDSGETVLYKGGRWIVTEKLAQGFSLKPEGGKDKDIVNSISREELGITRGCQKEICTKTSVIEMATKSYLSVEGIDFEGRYLTQGIGSDKLNAPLDFRALARTTGCVSTSDVGICAGNTVIARNNIYYKVVGIQPDNRVVLESEDNSRNLYFDVQPNTLTVTR